MWAKGTDDTDLLSSPPKWKHYPFQRLKRYVLDDIEDGFLKDHSLAPLFRVYLGTPDQPLNGLQHVEYETVEALLADGWTVEG
jgi:hypothetical protein